MAKKQKPNFDVSELPPQELEELKKNVIEFVTRAKTIDNEIDLLKEDRKALCEEFSEKVDMKTLNSALRVVKIQEGVQFRDTFELFIETISKPTV